VHRLVTVIQVKFSNELTWSCHQMVCRLCALFSLLGRPHGTPAVYSAPDLGRSTSIYCCLLWHDRINNLFCCWGESISCCFCTCEQPSQITSWLYNIIVRSDFETQCCFDVSACCRFPLSVTVARNRCGTSVSIR